MRTVESLLHRYEIDIGRCIAVLLIASGCEGLLSFILGLPASVEMCREGLFGWVAGVYGLMAALTYVRLHLGVALWLHRPLARRITIVLGWIAIVMVLVFAIGGSRLPGFKIELSGYKNTHPGVYEQVIAGVAMLSVLGAAMLALLSQKCRREFNEAQPDI